MPVQEPAGSPSGEGQLVVFGGKKIRRKWEDDQWFFSVIDIVGALTDSASPSKYWDAMKRREKAATKIELSTFCRKLRLNSFIKRTCNGTQFYSNKPGIEWR